MEATHERQKSVSTHMGNGLSIPHGTNEAKSTIRRSARSFVRYDEPVDWKGKPTTFVIVIAVARAGEEHLVTVQKTSHVFLDKAEGGRAAGSHHTGAGAAVLSDIGNRVSDP